jgi:hypothetical protein
MSRYYETNWWALDRLPPMVEGRSQAIDCRDIQRCSCCLNLDGSIRIRDARCPIHKTRRLTEKK